MTKHPRFTVDTKQGDRYVGSPDDGTFTVDGVVVPVASIRRIEVFDNHDGGHGTCTLVDGTMLQFKQWTTGVFRREFHSSLSGTLLLNVDSLVSQIRVEAADIKDLWRE